MAAGIGLGGEVAGHRDRAGEPGLLGGDLAEGDEFAEEPLRRRGEELRGDLDPRDLGDDLVRCHDPAGPWVAADPPDPVADHGQGQVEIGRRLDQPDLPAKVEVDHRRFERRVVRAVDQVVTARQARGFQPVDRGLDRPEREARGAEDPEHAGAAHRLDDLGRADPVGHRAGDVGEAEAVVVAKGGVAQGLGAAGGEVAEDRSAAFVAGLDEVEAGRPFDDEERRTDLAERPLHPLSARHGDHRSTPRARRPAFRPSGPTARLTASINGRHTRPASPSRSSSPSSRGKTLMANPAPGTTCKPSKRGQESRA